MRLGQLRTNKSGFKGALNPKPLNNQANTQATIMKTTRGKFNNSIIVGEDVLIFVTLLFTATVHSGNTRPRTSMRSTA